MRASELQKLHPLFIIQVTSVTMKRLKLSSTLSLLHVANIAGSLQHEQTKQEGYGSILAAYPHEKLRVRLCRVTSQRHRMTRAKLPDDFLGLKNVSV